MIFRTMLYVLGLLMKVVFKVATWKDPAFRQRIQDKTFLMQVKIKDQGKGRYYRLYRGKIKSRRGMRNEPAGLMIQWKDTSTAMKTLFKLNLKSLYKSVTKAIVTGDLVVEMEYTQTFAFIKILQDMANVYVGFLPVLKKVPGMKKVLG